MKIFSDRNISVYEHHADIDLLDVLYLVAARRSQVQAGVCVALDPGCVHRRSVAHCGHRGRGWLSMCCKPFWRT